VALILRRRFGKLQAMKRGVPGLRMGICARRVLGSLLLASAYVAGRCEAPAAATATFCDYVSKVESRLKMQHRSEDGFLASVGSGAQIDARLRKGELIIEPLAPATETDLSGAMLHHWRGTAFVRGATADDFERLMKDFSGYPQRFSPQVVMAQVLSPHDGRIPDQFTAMMRVRQHHMITVVMDTTYDVTFGRLDALRRYSISRSTRISEIGSPGTPHERALNGGETHGFLWRQNIYWSYEERDGGLRMQIESISLTRDIPTGLGWIVRPYVESVPRESLEFTLRSVCSALRK
jgi:hypothetical protein